METEPLAAAETAAAAVLVLHRLAADAHEGRDYLVEYAVDAAYELSLLSAASTKRGGSILAARVERQSKGAVA